MHTYLCYDMSMGLYGSFKSLFRGKTPYSGWGGLGGGYRPYSVWLPGTTYDYTEMLIQGLWKNSTVASGIDWLARNWSVPNLQVVRVDDEGIEDPIHNHPALTLLRRPHPYVGEAAFVGAYVRDASCYGNVWIEKIKNRLGEPVELKIWRADKVSPLFPTDGSDYLTAWRYNINGKMLDVPADRVIHIRRYIDMDQDRVGWSPLLAHVREIAVLNEASTYTASLLRNFAVPGLIATPKGDFTVSEDDAKAIKSRLKDALTGDQRGDPTVLTGAYELHKMGFTPEEIGLVEIPKSAQATVLAAMGLNTSVLGLNTDNTGAYGTYADAIRAAYVHGLIPLQKVFADEMTHQLLIDFEDPDDVRSGRIKFTFDYSPVEELDDREQIAANRAIRLLGGGVITINESRDIVGYGKSDSPDADSLGIARDEIRNEILPQADPAQTTVSEGDNIGSVKVPASTGERSKIEGERNSDSLSPSRSGVNKALVQSYVSLMAELEEYESREGWTDIEEVS